MGNMCKQLEKTVSIKSPYDFWRRMWH